MFKKLLSSNFFRNVLSYIVYSYIRLVYYTTRWRYIGYDEYAKDLVNSDQPYIYANWHGRLLMVACFRPKQRNVNAVISLHGDGLLIAKVMRIFGINTIYGSSNKGARGAIVEIIRTLKKRDVVFITPDGPRGPREKVSGNIIKIAQKCQVPILPISFATKRHKIIGSWDRFMLAQPCSKGVFIYGKPLWIDKNFDDLECKKAGIELEKRLNNITKKADSLVNANLNEAVKDKE